MAAKKSTGNDVACFLLRTNIKSIITKRVFCEQVLEGGLSLCSPILLFNYCQIFCSNGVQNHHSLKLDVQDAVGFEIEGDFEEDIQFEFEEDEDKKTSKNEEVQVKRNNFMAGAAEEEEVRSNKTAEGQEEMEENEARKPNAEEGIDYDGPESREEAEAMVDKPNHGHIHSHTNDGLMREERSNHR